MSTNLPLALLLLMGSGLLIYAGIKNPPGGVVGVLGSALRGSSSPSAPPAPWIAGLAKPPAKTQPTPTVPDLIRGGF